MTATFTVVVPSYGRPRALHTCLEALAAVEYPAFRVVVVDDGSPTPLAPIAEPFAGNLDLVVHRQPNAGPAAARNAGAALADSDYLAFTDDDCAPAPGWLSAMASALADNPKALAGGAVVNALRDNPFSEASQALVTYLYGLGEGFFPSNNIALPTASFDELGGFPTTYPRPGGEDRELCAEWRRAGGEAVYVPDAVVLHSHAMGWRSFVRQHVNYGRGAYAFHRRRAARHGTSLRVERPAWYLDLLRFPFRSMSRARALPVAGLLAVSQAANAAGFALELADQRRLGRSQDT